MPDKILHKRNLTQSTVPTTASLSVGELAINVPDGKLFLRQSGSLGDSVIQVGLSSSYALTASYVTPLYQNVIITGSIYIPDNTYGVYFSGSDAASKLTWNDTDGTLDLGLKGGNVTLQIGQEEVVRVVNKTGADLLESQYNAVRVRSVSEGGAQGQRLAVVLAQANNDANSATTIGIVTENISNNQEGFITTFGLVRGINTTGTLQGETWVDGDMIYLSPTTSGAITNIKPQGSDHTVILGYVVYAHNTQGKIFVKVDNGYEIDELHNVHIQTGSLSSGNLLVRSGSVWTNTNQLTGSYGLTGSLTATSFTGSLFGTSSYAIQALSASFASTANTASYVLNAVSSSFASTSSVSLRPVDTTGSTLYSTTPSTGNVNATNGLFLGSSAGGGATNANFSVFLGYLAGQSATNANESIFVGPLAGGEAANAPGTIALGSGAGYRATSASYSTLIGYYAGSNTDASTSIGSGNIIIGNNITLPAGTKNSINLGAIIFATGSYSTLGAGNLYSGSQAEIGRVGINKVTPIYTLDVSGSGNYSNRLTVTGSLIAATITGSLFGSASYATNALSASYAPDTTFPYTGSAIISGSLQITGSFSVLDSLGVNNINSAIRSLYGTNGLASVDWNNRLLNGTSGNAVVDWRNNRLISTNTSRSIDWETRTLQDNTQTTTADWQNLTLKTGGVTVLDWGNGETLWSNRLSVQWKTRKLYDSTPTESIDWQNRLLIKNNGVAILDWQNATFTGSMQGTASYATQALSASWAPAASSNTFIQFNDSGSLGGELFLTYDKTTRSLANGSSVIANGQYSHAEGAGSNTYGLYSHAEGQNTKTGDDTGYLATIATPGVVVLDSSYGDLTSAGLFDIGFTIGIDDSIYDNAYSFANRIVASSSFDGTNTSLYLLDNAFTTTTAHVGSITMFAANTGDTYWGGPLAHAEGASTIAVGFGSHAEGNNTQAIGFSSHAEGSSANSIGGYSHAEGQSIAYGYVSHAEGAGQTYGSTSHAEGTGIAGCFGYAMNIAITAGVIELDPKYGDLTALFGAGAFIIIDDIQGEIVPGAVNAYLYEIASSTFNATPATEITLVDTTVNTSTNKAKIGIYADSSPTLADASIGDYSHAEGMGTQTLGAFSHAVGNNNRALGYYQSVVGQFNQPVSDVAAFIIGDGVDDLTRNNLLVAASGNVAVNGLLSVTGSLEVTGSLTLTSGSITMPNRPAFRVVGNSSADRTNTVLSGSAVTVDYNQGNYYNNTTGTFTAPIAGLYSLYFNGRVGSANSQMQAIVYKNTNIVQLMWEAPGLAASTHFGVSGIVNLAANDTLIVQITIGSLQFDGNDSWGVAYIG